MCLQRCWKCSDPRPLSELVCDHRARRSSLLGNEHPQAQQHGPSLLYCHCVYARKLMLLARLLASSGGFAWELGRGPEHRGLCSHPCINTPHGLKLVMDTPSADSWRRRWRNAPAGAAQPALDQRHLAECDPLISQLVAQQTLCNCTHIPDLISRVSQSSLIFA